MQGKANTPCVLAILAVLTLHPARPLLADPDPAAAKPCRDWEVEKHPRLLADINKDGKADIVGFGDAGVWTALSNGDGTFGPATFVLANFGANQDWDPAKHVRVMADINRDGMADIVAFGKDGVWTALSKGDGTFLPEHLVLLNFGDNQGWSTGKHVRVLADINRDGRADIVAFGRDGVWTALSKGDGTFFPEKLVLLNFGTNQGWTPAKHVRAAANISSDGMADLVAFGDAGVWTALSRGDGSFFPERFVLADFGVESAWDPARHVRLLADLNRDGMADIVGFGNVSVFAALASGDGGFGTVRAGLAELFTCVGRLDFNLEWSRVDRNGFPINARWRWQRENPGIPKAKQCHYFSKTITVPPNNTPVRVPDWADCTDQATGTDTGSGWNGFICGFSDSDGFQGHLNWFTATYTGGLGFGDHNYDEDYYMSLATEGDPAMLNDRHAMHTEFDSDETIDHFHTRWWRLFRKTVDDGEIAAARLGMCAISSPPCTQQLKDQLAAIARRPKDLFRKSDGTAVEATLTGLFGVDLEHDGGKSELHPVFAMAAHVQDNPNDDLWAIFVRNTGDEGYCSHKIWKSDFTRYMFRLPWRPGMTSFQVLWGANESEFEGTPGTSGPEIDFFPMAWIDVTFTLPGPSQRPMIDGELHLKWQAPVIAAAAPPRAPAIEAVELHDEAGGLREAIDRLPPAKREQLDAVRRQKPAIVMQALPKGIAPRKAAQAQAPAPATVRLAAEGEDATRKQARDDQKLRFLCKAWDGKPPGVPPDLCAKVGP